MIDFRRNASKPVPLQIKGEQAEIVHHYKYLGTFLDDKLDWTENLATPLKKRGNQRLHFFKKLKSFHVNLKLLGVFTRQKWSLSSVITVCACLTV